MNQAATFLSSLKLKGRQLTIKRAKLPKHLRNNENEGKGTELGNESEKGNSKHLLSDEEFKENKTQDGSDNDFDGEIKSKLGKSLNVIEATAPYASFTFLFLSYYYYCYFLFSFSLLN